MSGKDMGIPIYFPTFPFTNPQPGNDMAFRRISPWYGNLHIPRHWGLHGFQLSLNLYGRAKPGNCLFSHTSSVIWEFAHSMVWELCGFLLRMKYLGNLIILECLFFPILFPYCGNSLIPCFGNCMDFCFTRNI